MSQFSTLNAFAAPQPLSVGNIVSVAVALYRKHFKAYLRIAFFAALWSIVPVYGWAKLFAGMGHICRMASFELVGQTGESEQEAGRIVDGRKWVLLRAALLQWLILVGLAMAALLVTMIVASGLFLAQAASNILSGPTGSAVGTLVGVLLFLLCYVTPIFIFLSRWFVVQPCISVEPDLNARAGLRRSWKLSKGSLWRMQLLLLVGFLVTLPTYAIGVVPDLLLPDNSAAVQQGDLSSLPLSIAVSLVVYLLTTAIAAPFWQALSAALYVDLRRRREGLGLQLTEPEVDWS